MLPEKLSNVLCSLRPNEDKLTFAAIFEMDEKFNVQDFTIAKTIIHSRRRFTYEEAQEIVQMLERRAKELKEQAASCEHRAKSIKESFATRTFVMPQVQGRL